MFNDRRVDRHISIEPIYSVYVIKNIHMSFNEIN